MDEADIYKPARGRITALVGGLSEDQLDTVVPATPLWRVRDVVAHLAGAATDIVNGDVEGAATDPWTAKQVADRQGRPIGELLDEWATSAPHFESNLPTPLLAFDVLTHEWDLRGALDVPGDKDTDDIDWVVQQFTGFIGSGVRKKGLPALRITAGTDEWLLGGGEGEPGATLATEPFEIFRFAIGRRSEAQIRAYDWTGDPEPYLSGMSVFSFAGSAITEP